MSIVKNSLPLLFEELPEQSPANQNGGTARARAVTKWAERSPSLFAEHFFAEDSKNAEINGERQFSARIAASVSEYGEASEASATNCRSLFIGVLVRQFKDAIGLDLLITNDEEGESATDIQERGINYFLKISNDFKSVCDLAGFDAEKTRAKVIEHLVNMGRIELTNHGNYHIWRDELLKTTVSDDELTEGDENANCFN